MLFIKCVLSQCIAKCYDTLTIYNKIWKQRKKRSHQPFFLSTGTIPHKIIGHCKGISFDNTQLATAYIKAANKCTLQDILPLSLKCHRVHQTQTTNFGHLPSTQSNGSPKCCRNMILKTNNISSCKTKREPGISNAPYMCQLQRQFMCYCIR